MQSTEPRDVRLVYLACAWLVSHRGRFLNEVDKHNIDAVIDFNSVYVRLAEFIQRNGEYSLPWSDDISLDDVANVLKSKTCSDIRAL